MMRKTATSLAFACLMLCTVAAKAQLEHGTFMVGSDIGKFKLSLDKGGVFDFNLSPRLGFFVQDNLALGLSIDFGLSTAKGQGSSIDYGAGVFGRYYISDPNVNPLRHGRFFFEGTVGISGTNPAEGDNTNGLGLGFGPGYTYFMTNNVGVEALVKYDGIIGFGSRTTTNNILLGVGLQVYLPSGLVKSRIRSEGK